MNRRYCHKCGKEITIYGRTGLCGPCAQTSAWDRKHKATGIAVKTPEQIEARTEIRAYIHDHKRLYGRHPHCIGCRGACVQYAAPSSVILWCPRIAAEGVPVVIPQADGSARHV